MEFSTLQLIHRIAVTFYIGYFFVKVFMVLLNRREQLAAFKKKTLILEIILPLLFIVTGIMMLIQGSGVYEATKAASNPWFHIKMTVMVIGIVLGIIGIKKFNKGLALASLLCFIGIYGHTEMINGKIKKGTLNTEQTSNAESNVFDASETYTKLCLTCHGADGTKGLAGAANLQVSVLSIEERIEKIKKGGGGMAAYENVLQEDEIKAMAKYIDTFRK